jgi:FtsH-binding integral membrane protein
MSNGYLLEGYHGDTAASASRSERLAFIRRTYAHLTGAVVAFVILTTLLIKSGVGEGFLRTLMANSAAWIGVMVLFIAGGFAAQYLARSNASRPTQYLGLALYVGLWTIIFLPILTIAETHPRFAGKNIAAQAGLMTLVVFAGLTAAVFLSKKDFSFLGTGIMVISFIALGLVICAVVFGFGLGIWFSVAMIALASACILYDTSNVLHHYRTDQHVGAALELFGSVAMLFYYILRLVMATSSSSD